MKATMPSSPARSCGVRWPAAYLSLLLAICVVSMGSAQPDAPSPEIAPDFTLGTCLGADTLRLADFTDNLVMLYFFDAGRVEGRGAFRYLNEWHRRYENDGLSVIGIHCPAFEALKNYGNAITAISRTGAKIPVGMDMAGGVCAAYHLKTLPTFMLLRPGGEIAFETSELRSYREIEEVIQESIREIKPDVIHPFLLEPLTPEDDPNVKTLSPTPIIVPGYATGVVVDCDSADFGEYRIYADSRDRTKGKVFLGGKWRVDENSISYQQEGETAEGTLRIIYAGKSVWLMVDFEISDSPKIFVKQDRSNLPDELWGKDIRFVGMGRPQVNLRYPVPVHIVTNPKYGAHELELTVTGADATFYYLFFERGAAE
jgi:hypothetical protein